MIFVVVGGVFIYREVTVATSPFGSVRIFGHLYCSAVNGARVRFPPRDSALVFEPAGLKLRTCRPSWHYGGRYRKCDMS